MKNTHAIWQGLTRRVEPEYPVVDRKKAIEIEIIAEVLINEEGKIVTARVVQGHPLFDETMLRALCRWEFRPFYHEGKPISVLGTVREVFSL